MAGMRQFIENFSAVCNQQGDGVVTFPWVEIPPTRHGVTLNFHTHGYADNTYHYKESFLKDWVQIDCHGYTGWHSSNLQPGLMPVAPGRLARMPAKLETYLHSAQSKYEQADSGQNFDFDYVFFPLQKPQDETSLFARFSPQEIVSAMLPWYWMTGGKIVIKRHPFCHSDMIAKWLEELKDNPHVIITDDNVVKILSRAKAVLTVNSSVGFEALLRRIPVLTFGASEYGFMTYQIYDLAGAVQTLTQAIQETPDVTEPLHKFAAAHLYDIHDPQDMADLYAALSPAVRSGWIAQDIPPSIDFSEIGNGQDFTLHGFSYPESWGTWTNADRGSLVFYHAAPRVKKLMVLKLRSYAVKSHPTLSFDILWNGEVVLRNKEIKYSENAFLETHGEVYIGNGFNALSFFIHNPIRAAEAADDFDVRLLGIGLESLTFTEAT